MTITLGAPEPGGWGILGRLLVHTGYVGLMSTGDSFEAFVTLVRAGILSDQEVAEGMAAWRPGRAQRTELIDALQQWKGEQAITGLIRTALRALDGLPPVPGD